MKMLVTKTIERADVLANNLVADTTTAYNPATSYVYNATVPEIVRVSKEDDNVTDIIPARLYLLLGDSDGLYPPDNPTLWFDNGATNKDKMFDEYINTQAVATGAEATDAGKIVLTIVSDGQYTVSCFGLSGTSIQFELLSSTATVLDDVTYSLVDNESCISWYNYFFDDFITISKITHEFPVRIISSLRITIVDTNVGSYPKIGAVKVGQNFYLGETRGQPSLSLLDFSVKERNTFGDLYLSQGLFADEISVDILLESKTADTVKRALTSMRGLSTVFDCNNSETSYSSLIVLGFFQDFDLVLEGARYSLSTLTIESLT